MSLTIRKMIVLGLVGAIFLASKILLVAYWLSKKGVVDWVKYINQSCPIISNCTFTENVASTVCGGAILLEQDSSAIIQNCLFEGNQGHWGGAIYMSRTSQPIIMSCLFKHNTAKKYSGGAIGMQENCSPMIYNCCFAMNKGGWGGGIVAFSISTPVFVNCTLWSNHADNNGGGFYFGEGSIGIITNCIIWNNTANLAGQLVVHNENTLVTFSHCDIEGGLDGPGVRTFNNAPNVTDGGGNINLLPELVDVNNNDLRLAATSPCIDVGDSNALPADTLDLDGDGDVNEQIPFDMDGNPRIVGQAVDMGAYESQALRIVYVDATDGETGNTALAAGGVFTAVDVGTTGSGVDDFWRIRAFANEGTIFESGGDWASNSNTEDCPRLVTMVAVPEDDYNVYVYFWADGDQWRIQAALADVAGDLPMYLANDSEGEAIVAVAEDFEEPVPMLTESNRTLWQVNLGTTGVTNMITVYVDDEPNHLNGSRRTWYDGIGYEVAAEP